MKQQRNPQNRNTAEQNEVEENEVQSIISNTERLQQIAETLGFDAIADSEPALFVRDWLNQFMGFGDGRASIVQKGGNGADNLNARGTKGKDRIRQKGKKGKCPLLVFHIPI